MATAKKTTVKKPVAKKAPATKKAPAKKPVTTKKTTVTKKVAVTATPKAKSFRVSTNEPAFGTFKITRQTIYWTILIGFIIFMQLWILGLQVETSSYIEAQQAALDAEY